MEKGKTELLYGETREEIKERNKSVPIITIKIEFPIGCEYRYNERVDFVNSILELMKSQTKECTFEVQTTIASIRREELKPKGSKTPL